MLKQRFKKLLPLLLGLALLGPLLLVKGTANATNPATINFQGKVVNSDGTNVANGTYSFVFRIYNTSSPTMTTSCTSTASCLWQETQASVSVTNGVFQVELGSACALTSGSCNNSAGGPINFASNNSLYLTMQFNGDTSGANGGFMSPLIHITSVPFALQADNSSTLGGLAAGNFVQLAQGLQTDSSTSNASIAINKTGSTANILTLQKSSANVLLLDNNGLLTLQPAASLTSGQTAFTQSLTNASSTGGTVNGYSQTITVSATTTGSTTNGFNISIADSGSQSNTNTGIKISLTGTNSSQFQVGVQATVNHGAGIEGITSSSGSVGSSANGTGVFGSNNGTAGVSGSYFGVKGISIATGSGTDTNAGVFGLGAGNSSSSAYGGYFALDSSSASTAGAALYASNSGVAANILQLQNNNVNAMVVNNSGQVVVGQSNTGGANGTIVFDNSSGTGTATITLAGNPTTNYTYQLPTGTVSSNQCLQSGTVSSGNVPLTFGSCSTGGGYSTVQDEGSNLTQRSTINFIGNSVACADNAGSSRTDCTVAPSLQNTYDNSSSPATITTSSAAKNFVLASGSGFDSTGIFQVQNDLGSNALSVDTTPLNSLISNTNFESTTSPWTYTGATGGSIGRNISTSYIGGASMQITSGTSATANDGAKYVIGTAITNSSTYTLSWYSLITGGTMTSISATYSPDGTTTVACTPSDQTVLATAWKRFSCTFASGTANSSAYILIQNGDTTTRTFYADAVQLVQASQASAYKETGINLQGTVTSNSIFSGLITLQPASSLLAGQSEVQQIFTNGSTNGGTINGYSQTITVNNTSSASTTNGINISLTDNTGGSLANVNTGVLVNLAGTNNSQQEIGIDISVNKGIGLRAVASSSGNTAVSCASTTFKELAICADGGGGTGVYANSTAAGSATAALIGNNGAAGTAANTYHGITGQSIQTASAAYTSTGVAGVARGGTGATIYGGNFSLQAGGATAGAALFANNGGVAATVLELQSNSADVFVVGNGGLITLQPADGSGNPNLTSGQTEISQSFTNASSTGGTVNGYSQTITVNNTTSASTTNGINISLTDSTTGSLANNNVGLKINLTGTNTSQNQIGADISVNNGAGLRISNTASNGGNISCGSTSGNFGICSNVTAGGSSAGILSENNGSGTSLGSAAGAGLNSTATATGTAGQFYTGVAGKTTQSTAAAYTSVGVYGKSNGGTGATQYGGYFTLGTNGATLGSALYASNSTVAANILNLQDNTTSVFTVGDGGLITLQPADGSGNPNLINGQTEISQSFTNASSTGGTVNGYSQTITVNNTTSASTTNGFNISITDNASALANTNTGLKISLAGSNTSQIQIGENVSVARGIGIAATSSGVSGSSVACQNISGPMSAGLCASDTSASTSGAGQGIYGYTNSSTAGSLASIGTNFGAGVQGYNQSSTTAGTSVNIGVRGTAQNTGVSGAYTSVGVSGIAKAASSSATTYGGYFALDSGNSATAGAALYATNSSVAANILQLQNNGVNAMVVNSSGNVVLGQSSAGGANGTIVFDNSSGTATATITLAGNPSTNFTYQLPTQSTINTGDCLQAGTVSSGTVPLQFGACSAGGGTSLSVNGTGVGSTANLVNTSATGTSTGVTYAFGSGNITTVIGNASTTQAGAVTNGSQSFAGDKIFQSTTNSNTAFQIQNSTSEPILLADTTSTDAAAAQVNYLSYSGFESGSFSNATAGWAGVNPTGGTTTLSQNTNKQHTFNGLFSASVAIGANTSGGGGLHTGTGSFVSAPPGSTTYIVSFYVKISTGTIASNAFTVTTTGGAGSCSPASGITINASGFQRLSCSLAAGAGSITDFKISDNVTTSHTLFIDGVQLQPNSYNGNTITSPTAYQLGEIQIRGVVTSPLVISNNGDSTSAFQVQKSNGSAVITADTLNGQVLLGNSSSLNGTLVFNDSSNANTVTLVSGATSTSYSIILPTAKATNANYCLVMSNTSTGATSFSACGASSTASVALVPEFAGAVMTPDGSNNSGTMTSDFCGNDGAGPFVDLNTGVCNTSGDFHNYYNWTSNGANDYDIFIRWRVPSDFASFSTVQFNSKKSATGDDVKLSIFTNAGAACGTATSMTNTASAWQTTTYTISGCNPSAGDTLILDVHMAVAANGNTVQMGEIPITYNRS